MLIELEYKYIATVCTIIFYNNNNYSATQRSGRALPNQITP